MEHPQPLVYYIMQVELILIAAGVSALIATVTSQWRKSKALEQAVKSMLKHNIVKAHQCSKESGCTTLYMRDSVHDMATEYYALKGNSFVKELVDEIDSLPQCTSRPIKKDCCDE